ncbi:MAG TPA: arginine--tRNA ligase [Candidatus Sulfotelmatobacter sp.]|nr:arginine--tRNA ligase [Candidatus Sulfotelmatobacter sp.]
MAPPHDPALAPSARRAVQHLLARAWEAAEAAGLLPALADDERPVIEVARPADPAHGDLATNLAFKLARPMRRSPLAVAETLVKALPAAAGSPGEIPLLSDVGAVAPGFINVRLASGWLEAAVDAALAAGPRFGHLDQARPRHVNVEFVSANPTGPLHIGNARGAFVGDLLCRVLEGAGHEVTREYYFNDFGAQVRHLGVSVLALRQGDPVPEEGYRGEYVAELAAELPDEALAAASVAGVDAADVVGRWASERVRAGIESSLARLGVRFDVWKSESSLYRDGWVDQAVERLRAAGTLYEQDGALWFRSTDYGDDKDRVVRRSNGEYTYFGSDIGYVLDKWERGFDPLLYLWGQDHHGTVARLRNAAQAMGLPAGSVRVLLIAWVRFVRDGREISMSKRAGEFITLDELLSEIGVDAARWFFAARGATVGIDFDIELAKKQSAENPVYYVQYAHARIASLLRKAAEAGLTPAPTMAGALDGDEVAQGLAKALLRLPEVVEDAAIAEETQGVPAYATELATTFHAYYRDRRVVDAADPATSAGRLRLVEATRMALANALALLGISAPEVM